jgi:hypothetical protein
MAELAPRFSGRNLGNGFALFGIGLAATIFGASLPPHFQPLTPAPRAKRTNVAVRVTVNHIFTFNLKLLLLLYFIYPDPSLNGICRLPLLELPLHL